MAKRPTGDNVGEKVIRGQDEGECECEQHRYAERPQPGPDRDHQHHQGCRDQHVAGWKAPERALPREPVEAVEARVIQVHPDGNAPKSPFGQELRGKGERGTKTE